MKLINMHVQRTKLLFSFLMLICCEDPNMQYKRAFNVLQIDIGYEAIHYVEGLKCSGTPGSIRHMELEFVLHVGVEVMCIHSEDS